MKNKLYNELFHFNVDNLKNVYVSQKSIYIQFLLYIFEKKDNDLLLVFSTLNEANLIYNELIKYMKSVYLFPEDDFMAKRAIAASPEFLFLRLNLLNNISRDEKKIVITHYNSLVKKVSSKNEFLKNKLFLTVGDSINRDKLVNSLLELGYTKESVVMNTAEFSVRGYVVDVFPILEKNPVRIEFFDDEIEKIKYFKIETQSSFDSVSSIEIKPIKENYGNMNYPIVDYLNNQLIVFCNYNEILKIENMTVPQLDYLEMRDSVFSLDYFNEFNNIKVNTIDNKGKYDLKIDAKSIEYYNNDVNKFIEDISKNNGVLYSQNENLIKHAKSKKINIVNDYLSSGFVYEGRYFYADNDLVKCKNESHISSSYKFGNKVTNILKLKVGDYVVHRKSGIGIYKGLNTILKNGVKRDYILIEYKGNDKLYVPVEDVDKLYKYSSKEGVIPTIHRLNSVEWTKTKLRIKERIKSITGELIKIYKERNKATIEPFNADDETQVLFENEFKYDISEDQYKCSLEIKKDLEKSRPMDRLLCGDVGYGKTEVIFRAIYKTVMNNKQVAYLCPTTILSHQQYESALERFRNYAVNIELINRHFTNKQVQEKLKRLKEGKIDVIIGTHRLLSKDVEFKNLGLFVIDEEHRFGVEQKERIKAIKSNVHVLSVSATPIPRSLQMSLVGIRDLSLIESAPKNRYPVQTYVIQYNEMLIREVVLKELSRKGQVFILYNNVMNMNEMQMKIEKLIPEARVCHAHGKMSKNEMQDVIYDFTNYKYDVLLSTTIIENGIDITNANTIIVIDADKFGLSQLYQIRGRVGRGEKIAYAYLMYRTNKVLSSVAMKRLDAIKEFTELGSGYKISMRDLSIRGAGDILGSEQAGFIDSVGVDMYLDLINEEVSGISYDEEESFSDITKVNIETHIGEEISDENEIIIDLHKKINSIKNRDELDKILSSIKDRFGTLNEQIEMYANLQYFENCLKFTGVRVQENNNLKIVLKLSKNVYENIKVEELFTLSMKITAKFNFNLKNENIYITLLKASLDKHYLFYCLELLELIVKLKK